MTLHNLAIVVGTMAIFAIEMGAGLWFAGHRYIGVRP